MESDTQSPAFSLRVLYYFQPKTSDFWHWMEFQAFQLNERLLVINHLTLQFSCSVLNNTFKAFAVVN